jgi:thiol-disulfide isomerase/thioredoxin
VTGRRPIVALCAALLLAGCTGTPGGSSTGPTVPAGVAEPSLAQLRADTAMARCPSQGDGARSSALPDVDLRCLADGPAVSLAALRGPAVVNLWASWCRQCVTEMPILEQVHQRASDGVTFLGVDFKDDPEPALEAAASRGVTYPSVQDPDGVLAADLKVTGLPVTLFVREDGTVAGRKDGEITSARELERLLARHLGVRL